MGLFSFLKGNSFGVERDRTGAFTYSFLDTNGFENSSDYLKKSLDNPVLMTIIALRCKIYSQMKISHINASGKEIKNSPYIKLFQQPNYFQSQQDFLFQQMWFLSATGNDLTYNVKVFDEPKSLYNLLPSAIDLNKTNEVEKLITTKEDFNKYEDKHIIYTLEGKTHNYKIKDLIPFYDLSNGLTERSFMSSPSRVKGIIKVVENIDETLKAKNINLKMAQKYLAINKNNINTAQIQEGDRKDIFSKIGRNNLIVTNAEINIQHLVSDMKRLFLDESFSNDALKCLLAFDMNKDILNYFSNGASTYENLSQSVINWIQNFVQLDADNTMNSFSSSWGLYEKGESLVASYDHLPVMAKSMQDKVNAFKTYQEALKLAIEIRTLSTDEAKVMSDNYKLKLKL